MDDSFLEQYLAKPDESLASHTQRLIENAEILERLGYIKKEAVRRNIPPSCKAHDLGKINSLFQHRVRTKGRFDESKEIGHNILSAYLVDLEEVLQPEDYYMVVYAVLNHHHYVDNYNAISEKRELIEDALHDIVLEMKKHGREINISILRKRLEGRALKEAKKLTDNLAAKLLKGFLQKCDYAASAHLPVEYPNDFLKERMDKMAEKEGYIWRELQTYCKNHCEDNLIISAPTGMGKTEASLLWLDNHKGFYVLPLKTAINAIYLRIKEKVLDNELIEERLGLLHGETFDMYLEGAKEEQEQEKFFDYYKRTRNMSLPLIVTTPDQIFDFVYKYHGHEMKLATLSYSKVIIDEIQAYSPDLLAYLIHGIHSIVEAGGQFAIFTATFPPFIKSLLLEPPESLNVNQETEVFREILSKTQCARFSSTLRRHHLSICNKRLSVEDIREIYERPENKKILVVCNTVKQSQEIFEQLKGCEGYEVRLLHAKFLQGDRKEKEEQILKDGETFLKDGITLHDKKIIWIATQIVEASLDIDFDYIFTELTDLSGLFQRLGRCNRKGQKSVEQPNCFAYTQVDESLFMKEDRGFIDRSLYELTKEALVEIGNGLLLEDKKFELIDQYFTLEKIKEKGSVFFKHYQAFYQYIDDIYIGQKKLAEVRKEFRNIISYKAIPKVVYEGEAGPVIQETLAGIRQIEKSIMDNTADKKQSMIEKTKLKQKLNQFCLNVGFFDLPKYPTQDMMIPMDNEIIYIIPGEYDKEIGFRRAGSQVLNPKQEPAWDAFM